MFSQLFKILKDATDVAHALSKIVKGDNIDSASLNGILAYVFRDSNDLATTVKLSSDGAIPVTTDPGEPDGAAFTQLSGAQTKGVETAVGEFTLALNKKYNNFFAVVNSSRLFTWRLVHVDDAGVTDTITPIGYAYTGEGMMQGKIESPNRIIDTTGGTGVQKLILYATPIDNVSDVQANVEYNEILS